MTVGANIEFALRVRRVKAVERARVLYNNTPWHHFSINLTEARAELVALAAAAETLWKRAQS